MPWKMENTQGNDNPNERDKKSDQCNIKECPDNRWDSSHPPLNGNSYTRKNTGDDDKFFRHIKSL